jgi:hypothetical protein
MAAPVTVSGTPQLMLSDGATAVFNPAHSDATQLAFDYTVGANDFAIGLAVTGTNLNGGAVRDSLGNPADLSGAAQTLGLDVNAAVVTAVSASQTGEVDSGKAIRLTLTMNESVTVNTASGTPTLTLSNGATATYDSQNSKPSVGQLVFDYTVGANDRTPDLQATAVNLRGAVIQDAHGHSVDLSGALNTSFGIQIGPSSLAATAVAAPHAGPALTGQTIQVILTMNEASSVDLSQGWPSLTLNDGGNAIYDSAHSSPTKLVFDYLVGANDFTTNLQVTGVNLNGATALDPAGYDATFSGALNVGTGLQVNTPNQAPIAASDAGAVNARRVLTKRPQTASCRTIRMRMATR